MDQEFFMVFISRFWASCNSGILCVSYLWTHPTWRRRRRRRAPLWRSKKPTKQSRADVARLDVEIRRSGKLKPRRYCLSGSGLIASLIIDSGVSTSNKPARGGKIHFYSRNCDGKHPVRGKVSLQPAPEGPQESSPGGAPENW